MEQNLVEFLIKTLDDLKAQDILAIDVKGKSSITDAMIIATGTSVRHVASTADRLSQEAKQAVKFAKDFTILTTYFFFMKKKCDAVIIFEVSLCFQNIILL